MSKYQGACACGAVKFSINREPLITQACHCKDCQKASGAPFVVNSWIEAENVAVTAGELKTGQVIGGSGKAVDLSFCDKCGTTLWSRYHAAPGNALFVRVCCLGENDLEPSVHIFTRSKRPWFSIPDGVKQFEGFYNPATVWPADSLARMSKMMEE